MVVTMGEVESALVAIESDVVSGSLEVEVFR